MILFFIGILLGFILAYFLMKKKLSSPKLVDTIETIVSNITLKEVENKGKKGAADSSYWLLTDGENKYLFTNEQLKTAKNRALKNPEDIS
jgi:bacillopeptidase F (M6 metalloprotease family)